MNNLQALKKAAEVYQQWQDHKLSDFKLIKFQKEMIEEYEKISTELLEMLREVCGEINIIPCTCTTRETGDINGSCPRCNYHSRELVSRMEKYLS